MDNEAIGSEERGKGDPPPTEHPWNTTRPALHRAGGLVTEGAQGAEEREIVRVSLSAFRRDGYRGARSRERAAARVETTEWERAQGSSKSTWPLC